MNILKSLATFSLCVMLAGPVYSADFDPNNCKALKRDYPVPKNYIDDTAHNKITNVTYTYVTKAWHTLTPEQKRSLALWIECTNQAFHPKTKLTEIHDAASDKLLASYGSKGFVSHEK